MDPMFAAGLPFLVPEILELKAFCDSENSFPALFLEFSRNFPAELPKIGFRKRGLLEKKSFQNCPSSKGSRDSRDSRAAPDCGKQRRIRPFLGDSRAFRDSRDSSSEKTPFVVTPFSGPEKRPQKKPQPSRVS